MISGARRATGVSGVVASAVARDAAPISDIRIAKSGSTVVRDVSGCGMTVWRGDQRSTFPSTRSIGSEIV